MLAVKDIDLHGSAWHGDLSHCQQIILQLSAKMPTCCAPGCLNNNNDDPSLSFFRLPWKNRILVDQWLAKLRLVNRPGKEARVCRQHFEDRFVVLDAKYKLAPELYPNASPKLTADAIPTIFKHRPAKKIRDASENRAKKRELEEVSILFL